MTRPSASDWPFCTQRLGHSAAAGYLEHSEPVPFPAAGHLVHNDLAPPPAASHLVHNDPTSPPAALC
jgi:hypothetical protein